MLGHKACPSKKAVLHKTVTSHACVFPVMEYEETIKAFAKKFDEGTATSLLICVSDPAELTSSSHQLGLWLRMTAGLKCGKSIYLVPLTDPSLRPLHVYTFAQMYEQGTFGEDERSKVYYDFVDKCILKRMLGSGRSAMRTVVGPGGASGQAASAEKVGARAR